VAGVIPEKRQPSITKATGGNVRAYSSDLSCCAFISVHFPAMTSRGTGIPEGPNAECESAIPLSCIKVPKRQTIRAVNESFCRQWLSGSEFRLDRLPRSLGPKLPPRNEHAALHPSVLSPPPHRTRGSHFHTRGGEAPKLANGCANGNTSGCRAIRNGSPSFGPRWEDPSWNPSKFSANVQRAATCSVMRQ
jgi:hypothetical protein